MKIAALAGGVGGAKLADGLARVLPPENLTIIVNTGDDFEHLGLYICPDLDTVCYTIGGIANPDTGWGHADETWHTMENLEKLGGPNWFRLGDSDLATHLERTRLLKSGQVLSEITAHLCTAWGVGHKILPMSDDPIPTIVLTEEGEMAFQEYFVARRCEPRVTGFRFEGSEQAKPAPGVLEAIQKADFVVLCPSNPWVSIDPILSVPGIYTALEERPVIAVSPIIGGKALKGPVTKMYAELGITPTAHAVAEHYGDLLAGFVLDEVDRNLTKDLGLRTLVTDTIMKSMEDRTRLGEAVLSFARDL
ncbi:MAG: 2-phospho-L-lactate transferase [Anaerolineales bacterium]|nr:MAG: 2-phospho-L-lactate transferase [Anaerolineales bacterium]